MANLDHLETKDYEYALEYIYSVYTFCIVTKWVFDYNFARFQGEQGESGLRGMPGAHGMPGEEGPRGPFGIDGCNGTNGASGFPGYPGSPGLFIIIIIFFPTICCLHRIFFLFVYFAFE